MEKGPSGYEERLRGRIIEYGVTLSESSLTELPEVEASLVVADSGSGTLSPDQGEASYILYYIWGTVLLVQVVCLGLYVYINRQDLSKQFPFRWLWYRVKHHPREWYTAKWIQLLVEKHQKTIFERHNVAVAPRQTEWSQLGKFLNQLKKSTPIAQYLHNTVAERRLFVQLGALLRRHPWAIQKRNQTGWSVLNSRLIPVAELLLGIRWATYEGPLQHQ
jgi:hypothetical protein